MRKYGIALILTLATSASAFAAAPNIQGGSSTDLINVTLPSTIVAGSPQTPGYAGIKVGTNPISGVADFLQAPIFQATNAPTDANGNRWATMPGTSTTIAQVWKSTANNHADISSLRQIITPPPAMPQFGGLVIGQVKAGGSDTVSGTPYTLGSGVYFGEWAPQGTLTTDPSTDLNMGSNDRTVWYSGDNGVSTTPYLLAVQYNVVGLGQVGETANNLPSAPDLYTGRLTANYIPGMVSSLGGTIANSSNSINFNGTQIHNDGRFTNTNTGNIIEGRFYNGAEALAGIYTGAAGASDDVAFGGSRHNNSGFIIPR